MSAVPQNLNVDMFTVDPLRTPESGGRLMELVQEHAPAAMPGRWGGTEPLREVWAPGAEQKAFRGEWTTFFDSGVEGAARMVVACPFGVHESRGRVHLTADDIVVDPTAVAALVKSASVALGADYAHVHLATDADAERQPRPERGWVTSSDAPGEFSLVVIERDLQEYLPELWWGTVLGREYVGLIGRDVIETAPAYLVERVGPDTYWVQLTEDARDNLVEPQQLAEARRRVKVHLGDDLFWAKGRTAYRAPSFGLASPKP